MGPWMLRLLPESSTTNEYNMIASLSIMAFIVLLMWFEKDDYKAWMVERELQKMIDQEWKDQR